MLLRACVRVVTLVIACNAFFGLLLGLGLQAHVEPSVSHYPYSLYWQRNQFATLCAIGIVLSIQPGWWRAAHRIPLIMVLTMAIAISASRTGAVSLLVLAAWLWHWRGAAGSGQQREATKRDLGLMLATYVLFSIFLSATGSSGVIERARESLDCSSRLTLWSNVLTLISRKPWLGWGWNELDYAHFITLYPGARFCEILDNAHNLPLHLAVELGIPVALGVCGLLLVWIARAKPWRETDPARQSCWAILMVIGIHSLLEYPLWYTAFQLSVLVCLLTLWQTRPDKAQTPEAVLALQALAWRLAPWAAGALLALAAFAAWNAYVVNQIYRQPADRAAAYQADTLNKVQKVWLFRNQARFALLTLTPLTQDNALQIHALALEMLHFSPEPRVIEPLIESAVLLGRDDEAMFYLQRYQAAFPKEHAAWARRQGQPMRRSPADPSGLPALEP